MTFSRRSYRSFRHSLGPWIVLAAGLALGAGCSTAQSPSGSSTNMNHILPSGASVAGWVVVPSGGTHASTATFDFLANGGSSDCGQCHGSDLTGGISGTSCYGNPAGCHHGPVAGWVAAPPAAQPHGVSAKKAPGSSGFASCQICHGLDFTTGPPSMRCASCHGSPPHPPVPWRGAPYTHTNTDPANAPVCSRCHFPGSPNNPANHPPTPAPAGTAPGCFNSTLCHGAVGAPHPVGSAWVAAPPAAQPHGNDAKAAPGATTGFSSCQVCHGTGTTPPGNFGGGSSGVSCYVCHGVNAPHASAPWRGSAGTTYTHTNADGGNAVVCQQCHFPGSPNNPANHPPAPAPAGTPAGCFNNTLCHGSATAAHPVPFNDVAHYSVTSGTFPGSCSNCHDVSAPSTKAGPVCQSCHAAASPLAAANCTSCHASPPDGGAGAAYANIAGAHAVHIALNGAAGSPVSCDTCHNGLGPSLANLNHYNRAKGRVPPGDVAFLATYNAQSGASSFDNSAALGCSNVSCHGGQTTPNWRTGTLDVNTQCTNCHTDGTTTTQFNGPTSANHNRGPHQEASCTFCHNTATLAVNHFTNLSTPALEGPASATIGGSGTLINSWDPVTKSCTPGCHGPETW